MNKASNKFSPKTPFENGLPGVLGRDSSLGCGPKRAVPEWLILRSAPGATRPI